MLEYGYYAKGTNRVEIYRAAAGDAMKRWSVYGIGHALSAHIDAEMRATWRLVDRSTETVPVGWVFTGNCAK